MARRQPGAGHRTDGTHRPHQPLRRPAPAGGGRPLRAAGLSRAEFDLLGAVRRTDHELTPGELARETFSSGAAVTKRLRILQERGLVDRRSDERDRRVTHVRLTEEGRALVDQLLPRQLAYERAVLSGLDERTRGELSAQLSELLVQLEGRIGGARR